jgi:hypothetical protein
LFVIDGAFTSFVFIPYPIDWLIKVRIDLNWKLIID